MTWIKLVPPWAYWVLALLLVAGGQQLRVEIAQNVASKAQTGLANYRTEVSERDRRSTLAALQETKRRMAAIDEVQKDAEQQLEAARTDAADAGSALERLKLRLEAAEQRSRDAGNSITAQLSQAAENAARMRADMLSRLGEAVRLYAAIADERGVAGAACEKAYDGLAGR